MKRRGRRETRNNDKGNERKVNRRRQRDSERRAPIDPSHYLADTSHRTIYKSLIMQRLPNRQTVVSSATGWQWRMGGRPGCQARGRANTAAIFVSAYLRHYFISIFPPFLQLRWSNSSLGKHTSLSNLKTMWEQPFVSKPTPGADSFIVRLDLPSRMECLNRACLWETEIDLCLKKLSNLYTFH